jgi:hypothetical protein
MPLHKSFYYVFLIYYVPVASKPNCNGAVISSGGRLKDFESVKSTVSKYWSKRTTAVAGSRQFEKRGAELGYSK